MEPVAEVYEITRDLYAEEPHSVLDYTVPHGPGIPSLVPSLQHSPTLQHSTDSPYSAGDWATPVHDSSNSLYATGDWGAPDQAAALEWADVAADLEYNPSTAASRRAFVPTQAPASETVRSHECRFIITRTRISRLPIQGV